MTTSRWDAFDKREIQDIHHALRMICKHPLVSDGEREHFERLANEVWDYHAASVASIPGPCDEFPIKDWSGA